MASYLTCTFFVTFTFLFAGSFATIQWEDLIVTFGVPFEPSPIHYVTLPRTVDDAVKQGWKDITDGNCYNHGKYNGFRYIKGDDFTLALIFDVQGFIAGAQANVLKQDLFGQTPYPFHKDKRYVQDVVDGHNVFTLTAYFVNPGIICTTGRSEMDFYTQGTGTQLYFQTGRRPCDFISPPRTRDFVYAQHFNRNQCFIGMGLHSYYDIDKVRSSNCTDVSPFFLLFNQKEDQMHGFGFQTVGRVKENPGSRFETPRPVDIAHAVGPAAPECLINMPMSTMHFWFVPKPWDIRCP